MTSGDVEGIRVLHVDDDEELLSLGETLLTEERPDIDVVQATAVKQATERFDPEEIDCILSDYYLPREDGLDLLEKIRARDGGIPFILYTGEGSEDVASDAISAGVSDYLRKSHLRSDFSVLANRIETLVAKHRAKERIREERGINSLLRDVGRGLVRADNRGELATNVCEAFTNHRGVAAAWFGTVTDGRFQPEAASNVCRGAGEGILGGSPPDSTTYRPDPRHGDQTIGIVPVTHDEETVGYCICQSAADQPIPPAVLEDIGVDIGDALGAIKTRETLRRQERHLKNAQAVADLGSWQKDIQTDTIYWSDAVYDIFGVDKEKDAHNHADFIEWVHPEDEAFVEKQWERALAGASYDIEHRILVDGETRWVRERADFERDETGLPLVATGIVQDITERKQREQRLKTLSESTGALQGADTPQAVAETIGTVLADTDPVDSVGVYLYDEDSGTIPLVTGVGHAEPEYFEPGDQGWELYRSGSGGLLDGDRTQAIPVGDHGMIVVESSDGVEPSEIRDVTVIVASVAREALARIERERHLVEKDATVQEQAADLDRLNRLNREMREVVGAIAAADTREDVFEEVCTRLARIEDYAYLGILEPAPSGGDLSVMATGGDPQGYFAALDVDQHGEQFPSMRAAKRRERVVIDNTAKRLRTEPWREFALTRDVRSIMSIPIMDESVLHGVLTIGATDPEAFDALARDIYVELGMTIGHAISSTGRQAALDEEGKPVVTLAVSTPEYPWIRVATETSVPVSIRTLIPTGDQAAAFLDVETDTAEEAIAAVESVPVVADASVIQEGPDPVLRVGVTQPDVATVATSVGGAVREETIDDHQSLVDVEFPDEDAMREAIGRLERSYADLELVAKTTGKESPRQVDESLFEEHTELQQEALEMAYHSGFFEWPRESTIEDLAASFDVASPTYSRHLRVGQRKLFGELFES